MNGKNLIDILEFLDDDLLMEADLKRKNRKKIIYIRTFVAVAACFMILILSAIMLPRHGSEESVNNTKWYASGGRNVFLRQHIDYITGGDSYENNDDKVIAQATKEPDNNGDEVQITIPQDTTLPIVPTNAPVSSQLPGTTQRPTIRPGNMAKPTQQPVIIVTPTQQPVITTRPTQQPVITVKPTNRPVITSEPTQMPPTEVPVPTQDTSWTLALSENEKITGYNISDVYMEYVDYWYAPKYGAPEDVEPTDVPQEPSKPGEDAWPTTPAPTPVPTILPEPSEEEEWEYLLTGRHDYKWVKRVISEKYIDEFYYEFSLVGTTNNGVTKSKNVNGYSIKGSWGDSVVAIQNDNGEYNLFIDDGYHPQHLNYLLKHFNLYEYVSWEGAVSFMEGQVITFEDDQILWDILSTGGGTAIDPVIVYYDCELVAALTLSSELYGYENIPVAIYEEGYMMIEWFDNVYAFAIGEEAVDRIMNLFK